MPITALPTPVPTRTDAANFNSRAEAFLSALPTFVTEANTLATDLTNKQSTASSAATTASTAATTATDAKNTAVTAKDNALVSATNAAGSATVAQNWAEKTDGPVTSGSYSSKYWAQIAQGFVVGTLIDNSNLGSTKVFTNQWVYNNYARIDGSSAYTGQIKSDKGNPNPLFSANYSLRTSGAHGGGIVMLDGVNQISMYSVSGALNFGFGSEGNITSKFVINPDGSWASGQGTVSGILYVNNEVQANWSVKVRNGSYPDVTLYNNDGTFGIYSNAGPGRLVHFDRTTNKSYFAGISSDDIWKFSAGGISKYPSGYCILPNGLIIQWARLTTQGDFTFPIAFPTACFAVTTSVSSDTWGASNFVAFTNNITRFGFQFATGGINYQGASYIAVGV